MFNKKYFATILVFYICISCSFEKVIQFKSCGPDVIQTVDVDPCDSEPCQLPKGTEAKLRLSFTSTGTATSVMAKAYGVLIGRDVPYPLPHPDGCSDCGLTCPLQPGAHSYNNSITIPKEVPDIRLIIKWELLDQSNQQILCFQFPAQVTG